MDCARLSTQECGSPNRWYALQVFLTFTRQCVLHPLVERKDSRVTRDWCLLSTAQMRIHVQHEIGIGQAREQIVDLVRRCTRVWFLEIGGEICLGQRTA